MSLWVERPPEDEAAYIEAMNDPHFAALTTALLTPYSHVGEGPNNLIREVDGDKETAPKEQQVDSTELAPEELARILSEDHCTIVPLQNGQHRVTFDIHPNVIKARQVEVVTGIGEHPIITSMEFLDESDSRRKIKYIIKGSFALNFVRLTGNGRKFLKKIIFQVG